MAVRVLSSGNMFTTGADAIISTVNCQGVMGKGNALVVSQIYPREAAFYREACFSGHFGIGSVIVKGQKPAIIFFPTKTMWRKPSKIEYIEEGLPNLRKVIETKGFNSVSCPALGCSNGALNFADVLPLIKQHLDSIACDVMVFEPESERGVVV